MHKLGTDAKKKLAEKADNIRSIKYAIIYQKVVGIPSEISQQEAENWFQQFCQQQFLLPSCLMKVHPDTPVRNKVN